MHGVTAGRRAEYDWLFRGGLAAFFPEQWERLVAALPPGDRGDDIVDAYHRLLFDADPAVRARAALAWCTWESATPAWPNTFGLDDRFGEPAFALAFARLVTRYVRHDGWVGDGRLLRNIASIAHVPAVLVNGRFDFQSPIGGAWELHRRWPRSELVIVDDAGHGARHRRHHACVGARHRPVRGAFPRLSVAAAAGPGLLKIPGGSRARRPSWHGSVRKCAVRP